MRPCEHLIITKSKCAKKEHYVVAQCYGNNEYDCGYFITKYPIPKCYYNKLEERKQKLNKISKLTKK
jgi:hypothetical protein